MSKHRPEVKEVECKDCGYVYNDVVFTECPQCKSRLDILDLEKSLFGDPDEIDNGIEEYPIL